MSTFASILILGSLVVFGGSAIFGFYWAARNGQFQNIEKGSETIFDAEEPIGTSTDTFPKSK